VVEMREVRAESGPDVAPTSTTALERWEGLAELRVEVREVRAGSKREIAPTSTPDLERALAVASREGLAELWVGVKEPKVESQSEARGGATIIAAPHRAQGALRRVPHTEGGSQGRVSHTGGEHNGHDPVPPTTPDLERALADALLLAQEAAVLLPGGYASRGRGPSHVVLPVLSPATFLRSRFALTNEEVLLAKEKLERKFPDQDIASDLRHAAGDVDREDASSMVTAGATDNTTKGNSRASRESGLLCSHSQGNRSRSMPLWMAGFTYP